MKFTVQYSVPTDSRIAVSDWLERTQTIEAETWQEAQTKFNKKNQELGTWLVLDVYPV